LLVFLACEGEAVQREQCSEGTAGLRGEAAEHLAQFLHAGVQLLLGHTDNGAKKVRRAACRAVAAAADAVGGVDGANGGALQRSSFWLVFES